MAGRGILLALLAVVASAAGVLSFVALRDLALMCGFVSGLAWLLPVVVDAGAAAGSLVWLGGGTWAAARRFARGLAIALLTLSVAANALGHALEAYRLLPPWWVVVAVSAIAPAVLGAVVHLAVLVGRPDPCGTRPLDVEGGPRDGSEMEIGPLDEVGMSRLWESAPPAAVEAAGEGREGDRAAALIAAGIGRRRLSRELGMSEHEARQLLERARNHTPASGEGGEAP